MFLQSFFHDHYFVFNNTLLLNKRKEQYKKSKEKISIQFIFTRLVTFLTVPYIPSSNSFKTRQETKARTQTIRLTKNPKKSPNCKRIILIFC